MSRGEWTVYWLTLLIKTLSAGYCALTNSSRNLRSAESATREKLCDRPRESVYLPLTLNCAMGFYVFQFLFNRCPDVFISFYRSSYGFLTEFIFPAISKIFLLVEYLGPNIFVTSGEFLTLLKYWRGSFKADFLVPTLEFWAGLLFTDTLCFLKEKPFVVVVSLREFREIHPMG